MNTQSWNKSPDAELDYGINWGENWLDTDAGEQLASSSWSVPAGITKKTDSFSAVTGITSITVSGGTSGTTYTLVNTITTSQGRTDSRAIHLIIMQR